MSKVVVVLGPGRSGMSVMVQLLHAAGLQLPSRLNPGDINRPMGAWEDDEILQLHRDARGRHPWRGFLPVRDEDLQVGERERIRQAIRRIVRERMTLAGDRLWGFKDPRTCFFLPIWNEVFDELDVTPIFIHCLRSPPDFVASFLKAYPGHPEGRFASLIYFWRSCYGLKHTNLAGYVAHYETWETDFIGQMKGVADYCGLDLPEHRMEALRQVYQPWQRRSDDRRQEVDPMTAELYRLLRNCTGMLSTASDLKAFIERIDQLLLQFAPIFNAMYASLDGEDAMKALLEEARQEAADMRAANALLLQRLDHKAHTELGDAVNEERRAKIKFDEARQALSSHDRSEAKDIHYRVGRKVTRGISRGPLHALAALLKVYAMRQEISKNGKVGVRRSRGKQAGSSRD